ncbi:hypothetical protein Tsubulata_040347, partial [Turnera subulata]
MTKFSAPLNFVFAVSRIDAQSEKLDLHLLLDVNTEIYPIHPNEKFVVLLTETLSDHSQGKSKADKFEYIMHGKLYKLGEEQSGDDTKMEVYISFGGFQMLLTGSLDYLNRFNLDRNYFLCMRKL